MSKMFESIKKIVKENKKELIIFFAVAFILAGIDQLTKWLAVEFLGPLKSYDSKSDLPSQYGSSVVIIKGFLNFTLINNNGAAFGIGGNTLYMRIIFILVSWIVFIGFPIAMYLYYKKYNKKISIPYLIAFILIYGGNIGNLIDRTFYWGIPCGVIDFIDITPLISGFGIFNFADSCVVVGVIIIAIILIVDIFKDNDSIKKEDNNDKATTETDVKEEIKKE